MSVLRMVKVFGWERKVKAQVDEKRVEELKVVFKRKLIVSLHRRPVLIQHIHRYACVTGPH